MKLLDERGIGTVWSICKEKFALAGHIHNYAGSGSPGGSANSAIGVVDYNQTGKTIQIGYSGAGITGDQIKYIAGYTDGSGNVNAKIKDVSKDALKSWLGLGSLAYSSSSIPTNLSQLNNDKGFVTGSVSGNTVTINGVSTTWTNTWRGIQDNLTSYSTSDSLSANQGRILKGLVDGKANSSHTHSWSQISVVPIASTQQSGIMSSTDKAKLDGIASGANNYKLPTASANTLGGIKTGYNDTADASKWAVKVDNNGNAYVPISGLSHYSNNNVSNLTVFSPNSANTTTYDGSSIVFSSQGHGDYSCNFPKRGGTFALTSDLSDVCKFNFVNSISECQNGKINFFLKIQTSGDAIFDIKDFENCEEGTILLLTARTDSDVVIRNSAHDWYFNMRYMYSNEHGYSYPGEIILATIKSGKIYVFKL